MNNTDKFLNRDASVNRLIAEYKKHKELVIGFDFDCTVHDYHKEGYSYEKCISLLKRLKNHGMKLICWTAYHDHEYVSNFLNEKGIEVDGINTDGVNLGYSSRKPFFNALLDDRAGLKQVYDDLIKLCILIDLETKNPEEEVTNLTLDAYIEYVSDKKTNKNFEPIFVNSGSDKLLINRLVGTLREKMTLLEGCPVIVVDISNTGDLIKLHTTVENPYNSGIVILNENMCFNDLIVVKYNSILVFDESAKNVELAQLQKISKDFDYFTNYTTLVDEVINIVKIYRY